MERYKKPEKSHIFWTLFFSKACPRKYRAPAMQNSIRAYARTSADRLTVAGENARKVTAIRLADLFATILIHLYAIQQKAVPARTEGIRSISSDRPRKRQK